MRRSSMGWALGVVAPWCLGMGLVVSMAADAGQNATVGGSLATRSTLAVAAPDDLVPLADLTRDFGSLGALGQAARRGVPAAGGLGAVLDALEPAEDAASAEMEPRRTLKRGIKDQNRPSVERLRKGDPALGLRPSFEGRLRHPGAVLAAQVLGPHDDAMPAAGFSLADEGGPLDGATGFAPWAEGEDMQGDSAGTTDLRTDLRSAIAMRPAALQARLAQGATPKVSRAEALSSTTPAATDDMPVVAVFPQGTPQFAPQAAPHAAPEVASVPNMSVMPREHPDYAALLTGERGARERRCLAEAVYFEARSEPEEGQAAVAQVVLNRATSGLYPASICGVVYQNRTHYKACQFSFACEGKSLRVTEPESWATATRISDAVLAGRTYLADVGGATHYHANYVRPGWARRLVRMDVIGHHVFYKLRHGQT